MTFFEIRQCNDRACLLRMPINPEIHRGSFCPRCGAPMELVVEAYQNYEPAQYVGFQKRRIEVILDNVRSAYNVGAIFRTADGVGTQQVFLCGITPNPTDNTAIAKTALGAQNAVGWSYHPNVLSLALSLREKGYLLLALEFTSISVPLHHYRMNDANEKPVVLVVGNEKAGIDPGLLEVCDAAVFLPMVGGKASLNVAVAFGAAAYWLSFV